MNTRRGPIRAPKPNTTQIIVRVDDDILAWLKGIVNDAGGGNYGRIINDILREAHDKAAKD